MVYLCVSIRYSIECINFHCQLFAAPRMINCPTKYSRVLVEVQEHSNVGLLYHRFGARDYLGEELHVHVSQQKFFACNCSFGQRVRANATAVDRHGGKSTCCFTVQIVGEILQSGFVVESLAPIILYKSYGSCNVDSM